VGHLGEIGPDRVPGDVLAEPDGERGTRRRTALAQVAPEDVPQVHHAVKLVGDLHPDRLLARDRGQDPDVGGRERVGDVVLQLRHPGDLGSGGEPQLVARDTRAGDPAHDLRLDAEMAERLHQLPGDLVLVGGVGALTLARGAQQLRVGQPVAATLGLGDSRTARTLRRQHRWVGLRPGGTRVGRPVLDLPLDLRERVLFALEPLILCGNRRRRRDLRTRMHRLDPGLALGLVVHGRAPPRVGAGLLELVCEARAGVGGRGTHPSEELADPAPGQEQCTACDEKDEDQVRARVREQRRGGPVQRLADHSAAVHHRVQAPESTRFATAGSEAERTGGKPKRQAQHDRDRPGPHPGRSLDPLPSGKRHSGADGEQGHQIRHSADEEPEHLGDRLAHRTAAGPDQETKQQPACHQPQPDGVDRGLIQLGQAYPRQVWAAHRPAAPRLRAQA
jgi:hypothetical protein